MKHGDIYEVVDLKIERPPKDGMYKVGTENGTLANRYWGSEENKFNRGINLQEVKFWLRKK